MKAWRQDDIDGLTVVTDPGLDDLLAFRLLERLAPQAAVRQLVSTFGNMPGPVTARNALDYIATSDQAWVYRRGAAKPLNAVTPRTWMDGRQGRNGLWGIRPEGCSESRLPKTRPVLKTERLISLGTFTEVKRLLEQEGVRELLIMGGLFDRFAENGNPAELNVRLDAQAASWVFENIQDVAVKVIPAELAFDTGWTREKVSGIPESSLYNRWLKRLLLAGFANGRYTSLNELYDPLAVFLAFFPECAIWQRGGIEVNHLGETTFSVNNPPCDIAIRLRDPKGVSDKLFQLIFLEDDI